MGPIIPSALIYQRETHTSGLGGSFGVVYKAIEISTGEIVAIKHVSNCFQMKGYTLVHIKLTNPLIDRPRV